jgi:hypothetical protein
MVIPNETCAGAITAEPQSNNAKASHLFFMFVSPAALLSARLVPSHLLR